MRRFRLVRISKRLRRLGHWTDALHGLRMGMHSAGRRAIILAGNGGTGFGPLIQKIGHDASRHVCRSVSDASMLELTRRRVALAIPPEQTLIVVTKAHQSAYAPLLSDMSPSSIVAQPCDRGSACALMYGLLRSQTVAPAAWVAIFPSDHYVTDDAAFMRHVDLAFDGVRARPDLLVLLGITPEGPGVVYSWIEMGERIAQYFQLFRIKKFWQTFSPELAMSLWRSGCLWNSSIMVGRIDTLRNLFSRALPELFAQFVSIQSDIGASSETQAVERLYAEMPSVNLTEQLLAPCGELLTVLPVSGVRWSSLREPDRLIALLRGASAG
jgi:mannose-1-phosphate guanylyltransferase